MQGELIETKLTDYKEIKKVLKAKGFERFYEKGRQVLVQESDTVQVGIGFSVDHPDQLEIKPKFPQIGNVPQIAVTAITWGLGAYLEIPFAWVFAIILGQVVSLAFFLPKINQLKEKVITALKD